MRLICATCAGLAITVVVVPAFLTAGAVLMLCYVTILLVQDDWLN